MNENEKLLETLSKFIPEEARDQIVETVNAILENATNDIKAESTKQLEEEKAKLIAENEANEKVAYEGYCQAYEIMGDLKNRLTVQKQEFDAFLNEQYQKAYEMINEERKKNEALELELYEEYETKLKGIKEYIVDKVDQFLDEQSEEFYESAKKEVLNDPTLVEHKLALDRIMDVAARYMDDEDFHNATSTRLDEVTKMLEEQKSQIKILEAKNLRISTDNNRLNESLKQSQTLLNESVKKQEKPKESKVEGRGNVVPPARQTVISEAKDAPAVSQTVSEEQRVLVENAENPEDVLSQWRTLAGIKN